jgi:hypothetical protein
MDTNKINSLLDLENWISKNKNYLDLIKKQNSKDKQSFANKVKILKDKLYPLKKNDNLIKLIKEYKTNNQQDQEIKIQIKSEFDKVNKSDLEKFDLLFSQLSFALIDDPKKISRASRSRKASSVFRTQEQMNQAVADIDGNTAANGGDLGIPGAYTGLKIVVLKQYTDGQFTNSYFKNDLSSKGFDVEVVSNVNDQSLNDLLNQANQFWLISGNAEKLTNNQLDRIVEEWENGMGVYVFGDNNPYYVDANRLLTKMNLPTMSGNWYGCNYLEAYSETTKKGFISSLPMTGILNKLYEGETIAEFDEKDVLKAKCKPIMYNSRGGISVIMRDAMDSCGQVICDGAFTKLYCKYDAAGSKWLVVNSACFLAVDFSSKLLDDDFDIISFIENSKLNMDNAFKGNCGLTSEENSKLSLLSFGGENQDEFTRESVFKDILSFGDRASKLLSTDGINLQLSKMLLPDNFIDDNNYSAAIPLVSLKHQENQDVIAKILSYVFMNGTNFTKEAFLLYLAANDSMIKSSPEKSEIYQYNINQILDNITFSSDLAENGDLIPLIEAMKMFSKKSQVERIRKSFKSVCLMARLLHDRNLAEPVFLTSWIRQSLIKEIVSFVLECNKGKKGNNFTRKWYTDLVKQLCYNFGNGEVNERSGHTTTIENVLKSLNMEESLNEILRVCSCLNKPKDSIFSDLQITALVNILMNTDQVTMIRHYAIENFMTYLIDNNNNFNSLWQGRYLGIGEIFLK